MKGIYCLLIKVKNRCDIQVGALGEITFETGFYVYVGSAQNGLEARVSRHLSDEKNIHWHIDYLLERSEIKNALVVKGPKEKECEFAQYMSKEMKSIEDFGCSDCGCDSHLFYWGEGEGPGEGTLEGLKNYLKGYPGSRRLDLETLKE